MRLTSKKGKVEDTHTRQTYLIRNSLLERFTKAAKNKHKGFKTEVVNLGIEMVLDMWKSKRRGLSIFLCKLPHGIYQLIYGSNRSAKYIES